MPVSWSTTLLRMDAFAAGFTPSLELPLKVFRACSPFITVAGLGVVVWWRNRRAGVGMRRCLEVTVEMVCLRGTSVIELSTDAARSRRCTPCPVSLGT